MSTIKTNGLTLTYRFAYLKGQLAFHLSRLLGQVGLGHLTAPRMRFDFEHVRGGATIDRWTTFNLVTTVGKTDILDKYLKGASYTAAWFMGLKSAGAPLVADTLASNANWDEVTPYTGNRPTITWGTTAAGANTGTAVPFAITASETVAGAFVCSVNTGTSGTLYNAADFAASRTVADGDTLNVTPTLSIA
jgi:hypothetical protein